MGRDYSLGVPRPQQRIVCAANRHGSTGLVVCGARHYDEIMRKQMETSLVDFSVGFTAEGFVDQFGKFLTRCEAWRIAEAANQIVRRVGGDHANGGTLYSENLY